MNKEEALVYLEQVIAVMMTNLSKYENYVDQLKLELQKVKEFKNLIEEIK